ncbi:hypothetical protein FB451DRAFT_1305808, partial [Mycena latifolia]
MLFRVLAMVAKLGDLGIWIVSGCPLPMLTTRTTGHEGYICWASATTREVGLLCPTHPPMYFGLTPSQPISIGLKSPGVAEVARAASHILQSWTGSSGVLYERKS